MSPTSYQAALPRVILSLLSATLIIIPYSNGFVKRVRKVFLQRKQRMKTRLLTFFPENQQPRQFTPLREGRQEASATSTPLAIFQFTPLREGRLKPSPLPEFVAYFNSRPSARGDCLGARNHLRRRHFNSRPSARGDKVKGFCVVILQISIHAPPRGATRTAW